MDIPPDVYRRILDLSTGLIDALDDTRERWSVYGALRDYCFEVAARGQDHPFLWETLADFTSDDRVAIDLYLRGLALADAADAVEYQASICLALAQRHASVGDTRSALGLPRGPMDTRCSPVIWSCAER